MQIDLTFQQTWLYRVNPSVKLIVSLLLFVQVLLVHHIDFMINLCVVTLLLLAFFTGHPWRRVLLFSIPFVIIFISTATSMIFFGKGDTTWFRWGLVHITEESFYRGLHLGFRALSFASVGLLFALTTRPVFLFYSLMKQLKLPPKYAYSFMAAIRLFPIMLEEFQTLRYALKVRGVREERGIRGFYQKLKFFSIPLLAQSIRRAQRMAVAMEAKRFAMTQKRTYFYKLGFSINDFIFVLYLLVGSLLAYWISHQWPYVDIVDVRYYND
ncbi:energy-coupling factor transporter transmembrane component T family protein [Bacillus horti]|uniref:Energy-coupling factor transport system permease protein n=1 Tax=Caldalkalibacillus horti TaxID=77523 RepID=A0ABT9W0G3_9BACI|nr:energy-coupling factor transporter transmembrane component T [Bacillus horti]MDQ0166750.1 energy-coupling factor transport system permease protein [Bacillus horti]